MKTSNLITPANIDWQIDDTGNKVPVSGEFGDVYFSHADGLAESRYVFIEHNRLPARLAALAPQQCFTIAELGFGTGLNLLAVWHLWQHLRATHAHLASARLHFITTERHPIPHHDLVKILDIWKQRAPELSALIASLLAVYPPLIAGCHRLLFGDDNLTVDIWLGDAACSLAKLNTTTGHHQRAGVDAWLLDGFAPSCNQSLWSQTIFAQLQRLSHIGTTAATYSCAGVVKRGLSESGFVIKKVKGFGRKNEMLTAIRQEKVSLDNQAAFNDDILHHKNDAMLAIPPNPTKSTPTPQTHQTNSIVIGAGIAGLMSAWSLANRGIRVTLLDKTAPLSGASGNPRALLAPKMTPIHHVDEHLHSLGYLYSNRLYRQLNHRATQANIAPILEPTGALDLLLKANVTVTQIADYPDEMATTLAATHAHAATNLTAQDLSDNLYLPDAGLVNPQALKSVILTHPLIQYQQLEVSEIQESQTQACVVGYINNNPPHDSEPITLSADTVVICAAFESHYLDARIFDCRKIRGQLSWFTPTAAQWEKLPTVPLKYSGYCAPFTAQPQDDTVNNVEIGQRQLLLGASFVRDDIATDIRDEEHQISRDKLIKAIPELTTVITSDTSGWHARAGVRTQTPDYHPILGQVATDSRIWTLSAMGAKGYAYAPLCAEVLADMMLGSIAPVSIAMLARLAPQRPQLQTPLT